MKEKKKHPQAEKDSETKGEAAQSKAAAAGVQANADDVQAYSEPSDSSGGGKLMAEPSDASGGGK